jgi:hypothetical protein
MGLDWAFDDFIRIPAFQNFQTTRIAGRASADEALRVLVDRFSFVGLTERYAEGMEGLAYLVRADEHFGRAWRNRADQRGLKVGDCSKTQLEYIRSTNSEDIRLVEEVQRLRGEGQWTDGGVTRAEFRKRGALRIPRGVKRAMRRVWALLVEAPVHRMRVEAPRIDVVREGP